MVGHQQHMPPPPRGHFGAPRQSGGKALPVAIGAGLAVGVFLGLLLIRGTGESEAESSRTDERVAAATADAGAAAIVDAAVAAAVVVDAAPTVKTVSLTFELAPSDAEDVVIEIDGKTIEGTSYKAELPIDAKPTPVTVSIKAKGFRSYKEKHELDGERVVAIELEPRKRSGGGSGGHKTGGGTRPGPGGLIDL